MFLTFDNNYRCKLSVRALVDAESILGQNPLNVFVTSGLPKLGDLLTILWCAMKYENHGIKRDDIYSIYEDYMAHGGDFAGLAEFVTQLFENSGLMHNEPENGTGAEESANPNA